MYYLYDIMTVPKVDEYEYHTAEDMEKVDIIEWPNYDPNVMDWGSLTPQDGRHWWPIHSSWRSYIPADCSDIEEAKAILLDKLNENLYEKYEGI